MERVLTQREQKAWELYCKETAGDLDVADFWWELPKYVQNIYLRKIPREGPFYGTCRRERNM